MPVSRRSGSGSGRCSTTCRSRCSTRRPSSPIRSSASRATRRSARSCGTSTPRSWATRRRCSGGSARSSATSPTGCASPTPERAVVERLARFMDASVAVLAPDGSVSVAVGKAPFAALRLSGHAVIEAEADGWCARRGAAGGRGCAWLARARQPARPLRRHVRQARRRRRPRRCSSPWTSSRRSLARRSWPSARRCSTRRCRAATRVRWRSAPRCSGSTSLRRCGS